MAAKRRAVKSDAERASAELAVYEKRVAKMQVAMARAREAYEEVRAEYEAALRVRDHLAAHPALRGDDELPGLAAETLPVPIDDRVYDDEPALPDAQEA